MNGRRGDNAARPVRLIMAERPDNRDKGPSDALAEEQRQPYRPQAEKLIDLAVMNLFAYVLLGALGGVVAGLAAGAGLFVAMTNMGLFDGIATFSNKDLVVNALKIYYMIIAGFGLSAAGMGVGLRHAMVSGHVAVARLTLSSAMEQAIRNARGSSLRGGALQSLPVEEIEVPLREAVDELSDYIDGYGIRKYFRRYVSTITVDFIEEVTLETARRNSPDITSPAINKDAIIKTQDAVLLWVKKRATRNTFLITVLLVTLPILAATVFLMLPAGLSTLLHNFHK